MSALARPLRSWTSSAGGRHPRDYGSSAIKGESARLSASARPSAIFSCVDGALAPNRRTEGSLLRRRSASRPSPLAVLDRDASDVRAHRRLVIERPVGDLAEGRIDAEALRRGDQFLGVDRNAPCARQPPRSSPRCIRPPSPVAGNPCTWPGTRSRNRLVRGCRDGGPGDNRSRTTRRALLPSADRDILGSPPSRLNTGRSLNKPRSSPSRTNLERSPANSDEKIASGLLSIMAWTTGPASILPSGTAISTNSIPELPAAWRAIICCLNAAVADLPYS